MKRILLILAASFALFGCEDKQAQLPPAYKVVCDGEGNFSFVNKGGYINSVVFSTYKGARAAADSRRRWDYEPKEDLVEQYNRVQAMNWKECEGEAK